MLRLITLEAEIVHSIRIIYTLIYQKIVSLLIMLSSSSKNEIFECQLGLINGGQPSGTSAKHETSMLDRYTLTYGHLGSQRVYLPFCKVADTPFQLQGDDICRYLYYCSL